MTLVGMDKADMQRRSFFPENIGSLSPFSTAFENWQALTQCHANPQPRLKYDKPDTQSSVAKACGEPSGVKLFALTDWIRRFDFVW